jgi:hypothetical protein
MELERTHQLAEQLAKTELAFGLLYVVLLVWTLTKLGTTIATPLAQTRAEGIQQSDPDTQPADGGGKMTT